MPMTNPFEWYDKHFDEIEIVNPTRHTRMKARRIKTGGILITTSDPLMLKQLKKEKERQRENAIDRNYRFGVVNGLNVSIGIVKGGVE